MSEDSSREQCYSCPECHGGNVRMQHVVYYTWVSGELITVPDFPAWICDMCGMREYDQRALSWLNIILSPDTGRKYQPQPKQKKRSQDTTSIQPEA